MALAQRLWKAMSRHYQKNVAGRVFPRPASSLPPRHRRSLSEFGLKYDDIRIESDADYAKALDRLQQCVQIKFNAAFRATRREYLYVAQPSAPAARPHRRCRKEL